MKGQKNATAAQWSDDEAEPWFSGSWKFEQPSPKKWDGCARHLWTSIILGPVAQAHAGANRTSRGKMGSNSGV